MQKNLKIIEYSIIYLVTREFSSEVFDMRKNKNIHKYFAAFKNIQNYIAAFMLILTNIWFIASAIPVQAAEAGTVTISFAGDCTLGSYQGSGNQFAQYWGYGPEYYLANVAPVFATDDITFVNLEGPLTLHPQTVDKEFPMRGEPVYGSILQTGSVEVVNLSNNHIYDCGDTGFYDTIATLDKYNIKYAGEDNIAICNIHGITTAFLGYKGWSDTETLREKIQNDITMARTEYNADIVCVEFHWGQERVYYPNSTQTNLGHFTIDAGADIVVGAHPHVIQGIEMYQGKVIAYSLGNFCFGGNSNPADKDTFILQVTFDQTGNTLRSYVIPCTISSVSTTNDFCPTIATSSAATPIIDRLRAYSQNWDTIPQLR